MKPTHIVSKQEWLEARKEHLQKEKEFDRLRDELSAQRRNMPWTELGQNYRFEGPQGQESMADLFAGNRQLIVYHFMYHPSWENGGCPSCSYLADHFDGMIPHLDDRGVSFVVISKATLPQIEAYKQRLGWKFKWVSAQNGSFNEDFNVSFTPEQMAGEATYNYQDGVSFPMEEAPGASVFALGDDGTVYHTYSTFARGLDRLIGTYHFLDMVPRGRNEDSLDWPMQWVRRHDEYEE